MYAIFNYTTFTVGRCKFNSVIFSDSKSTMQATGVADYPKANKI